MKIGGALGYHLLRWFRPRYERGPSGGPEAAPALSYVPKIERILGSDGWDRLRGKSILDFGCGTGGGCIEMARHGARRVIGLDIRPEVLETARRAAAGAGVADSCTFTGSVDERVDVIVSIDAFEHFGDPLAVLAEMDRLLKDDGLVVVSFGPTWDHPKGGHSFSIFPWAHLIFSEAALIRWRADFKHDGATRFSEVSGGLNRMTIKRFVGLVDRSPFRFASFRARPIRPMAWAHNRLTREFFTSVVECTLVKRVAPTG